MHTIFVVLISLAGFTSAAQNYCASKIVTFKENFVTNTRYANLLYVINSSSLSSALSNYKFYNNTKRTQQLPEWHALRLL